MKKELFFSSSAIKIIAVVCMAIDHFGAVFLGGTGVAYVLCRSVGRLSFPLFCFLIAQGFHYTKSRKDYFLRLCAFAFISEIPYNLAFSGKLINSGGLNVFFTLLLGFAAIWVLEEIKPLWLSIAAAGCCMAAAYLLGTDYGWYGVALIIAFYLTRTRPRMAAVCLAVLTLLYVGVSTGRFMVSASESLNMTLGAFWDYLNCSIFGFAITYCRQLFACFAAVPILLYNGQKGNLKNKYFFYAFYPAHLVIFYVINLIFA